MTDTKKKIVVNQYTILKRFLQLTEIESNLLLDTQYSRMDKEDQELVVKVSNVLKELNLQVDKRYRELFENENL